MPIEVEARYVVPDRETFRRLRRVEGLARYTITIAGEVRLADHYLDTLERALTRRGWSCRLRAACGTWTLTLKGPKSVRGAVVSREEREVSLPGAITHPSHWPEGPLRREVERLTRGHALCELAVIRQHRRSAIVRRDGVPVIDMGFDVVCFAGQRRMTRSYMVECELMASGTVTDLERLDEVLVREYGLIPEPRTKLQRALEYARIDTPPGSAPTSRA